MLCGVKCSMSTLLNCNSSVYNADGIEEENLQISHLTGWNSSGAAAKAALCMYSGSESFFFFLCIVVVVSSLHDFLCPVLDC